MAFLFNDDNDQPLGLADKLKKLLQAKQSGPMSDLGGDPNTGISDMQDSPMEPAMPTSSPKPMLAQGPQKDEYGLDVPEKKKSGPFGDILRIALPALLGLSRGVGIIPGLAFGAAGNQKHNDQEAKTEQDSYLKNRTLAQKTQSDALRREETGTHNRALENYYNSMANNGTTRNTISQQNANTNQFKALNPTPAKSTELDEYLRLKDLVTGPFDQAKQALSPTDMAKYRVLKKRYEKSSKEDEMNQLLQQLGAPGA